MTMGDNRPKPGAHIKRAVSTVETGRSRRAIKPERPKPWPREFKERRVKWQGVEEIEVELSEQEWKELEEKERRGESAEDC